MTDEERFNIAMIRLLDKDYIAKKIKNLREGNELTQRELGNWAGAHYTKIRAYENAEELPSLAIIMRMTERLGISMWDFLMEDEC